MIAPDGEWRASRFMIERILADIVFHGLPGRALVAIVRRLGDRSGWPCVTDIDPRSSRRGVAWGRLV